MDIFGEIVGVLLIILGIAGCVLPALPGPQLVYGALVLIQFTFDSYPFSPLFMFSWLGVIFLILLVDYFLPLLGTKKFGGSKRGNRGCIIGTVIGIFLGPRGIIIGPFLGAYGGEVLYGKKQKAAFKSAFGSFIGFLGGTVLKLVVSGVMAFSFIKASRDYFF